MLNGQQNHNALPPKEARASIQVESHLIQGLELMKTNEYREAIRYFNDGQPLEGTGVEFNWMVTQDAGFRIDMPPEERMAGLIDSSGIFFSADGQRATLTPNILIPLPRRLDYLNLQEPPAYVYHEIALKCAEGWLYALRYLNGGKSLAGYENENMDTVTYLYQHGVPMTKKFLAERATRKEDVHTPLANLMVQNH